MDDEANATRADELRGVSRLAIEGIVELSEIVESMHRTIQTVGGLLGDNSHGRTRGITGLVYWNIRAITRLVGSGLDVALEPLVTRLDSEDDAPSDDTDDGDPTPGREAVRAALNGVIGDHLVATQNPLAIPTRLRRQGRPVDPNDPDLREDIAAAQGRVLLMVHGSCSNDLQWKRRGHDHGAALADELGHVPLYAHYNSGRHISDNGAELAALLEQLAAAQPNPIELTILAHSMGGLVTRSTCHHGDSEGHGWVAGLHALVFLATPHHGALLERGGHNLHALLLITPYTAPFARLARVRGAGITDLRYGNLLEEDWRGRERFARTGDGRRPVPLPDGVACHAVAATLGASSGPLHDGLVGDGLVTVASALGRHEDPDHQLDFPEERCAIVRQTGHLEVLSSPEVYRTVHDWLAG